MKEDAAKLPGIYLIQNVQTGKCYVGRTVRAIRRRWWKHRADLRAGTHANKHLQRSFDKYGEDAFLFSVLHNVPEEDWQQLGPLESFYIEEFDSLRSGYNLMGVDSNGVLRHTPETKEKIRASRLGKPRAPFSEEWRKNMGLSHVGVIRSDETRARIRQALAGLHKRLPNLTAEQRKRISDRFKGIPFTQEHRDKIARAKIGSHLSDETKAKLSLARKGKPRMSHPFESRKKISEAHLKRSNRTPERDEEIRELSRSPKYAVHGGKIALSRDLGIPRATLGRILANESRLDQFCASEENES